MQEVTENHAQDDCFKIFRNNDDIHRAFFSLTDITNEMIISFH